MKRMMLLLQRSPEQETALRQLMDEQQSKDSPNFHKWLTPQQFGQQFGPAGADVQAITDWLTSQGFHDIRADNGHLTIEFSGDVGQVRKSFRTEIHQYLVNGEMRQQTTAIQRFPRLWLPSWQTSFPLTISRKNP
jgi:subtilase family serine protease